MSIAEARQKNEAAKKAVEKSAGAKEKLRERLEILKSEAEKFCDFENQKKALVAKLAVGEISESVYNRKIEELERERERRESLYEQISVIEDLLVDASKEGECSRKTANEAESQLYLAIASEIEEKIKEKIPARELQMLAFARLRSGRFAGSDAWTYLLMDVCGEGRFTDMDLKKTEAEMRKLYNF